MTTPRATTAVILSLAMTLVGCDDGPKWGPKEKAAYEDAVRKREAERAAKPATNEPGANSGQSGFDALDILPSVAGDLRIRAAWRLAFSAGRTTVLGVFRWINGGPEATLTCSLPPSPLECDESVPIKLRFGSVRACGADSTDEPGEGPMILWNGCDIRLASGGKREFNRLKDAVASAIPWTQKALDSKLTIAEWNKNRQAGLLDASRTGNPNMPSLSHQLDR